MQSEERFLVGFRSHVSYVKLLAELELFKEPLMDNDDEDTESVDELSFGSETASVSSLNLDHREGMCHAPVTISKFEELLFHHGKLLLFGFKISSFF